MKCCIRNMIVSCILSRINCIRSPNSWGWRSLATKWKSKRSWKYWWQPSKRINEGAGAQAITMKRIKTKMSLHQVGILRINRIKGKKASVLVIEIKRCKGTNLVLLPALCKAALAAGGGRGTLESPVSMKFRKLGIVQSSLAEQWTRTMTSITDLWRLIYIGRLRQMTITRQICCIKNER